MSSAFMGGISASKTEIVQGRDVIHGSILDYEIAPRIYVYIVDTWLKLTRLSGLVLLWQASYMNSVG